MLAPLAVAAIAGCPVFPASNPWNQRVDALPVHPRSDAIVRSIGLEETVHPDFGSGRYEGRPIGIPYQVVARDAKRSRVRFEYADESDRGPYPIPRSPRIEGGGDRHMLMVQRGTCRLFELFAARAARQRLDAPAAGAIFNLRSNRLRPRGWTSADAAGLPIFPGLARYDEVAAGEIRARAALHGLALAARVRLPGAPLRVVADRSRPARDGPAAAAQAQRADSTTSRARRAIVARALQRYGMLVADNGSDWFISGAPDPRWDNDDLRALKRLRGSDFEVVSEAAPRA